jgi:hypothetical protein
MSQRVNDNYGGIWVKQVTNLVREKTLKGCDERKLLLLLRYEVGLTIAKAQYHLNDMYYLGLIEKRNNGKIYWFDSEMEALPINSKVDKEEGSKPNESEDRETMKKIRAKYDKPKEE